MLKIHLLHWSVTACLQVRWEPLDAVCLCLQQWDEVAASGAQVHSTGAASCSLQGCQASLTPASCITALTPVLLTQITTRLVALCLTERPCVLLTSSQAGRRTPCRAGPTHLPFLGSNRGQDSGLFFMGKNHLGPTSGSLDQYLWPS